MNNASTVRLLAFLLFISCAVSALCLGLLAFTYATGDLLFGVQPLLIIPEKETKPKAPEEIARAGETYAVVLYRELVAAKEKLSTEQRAIDDKTVVAEETIKNAEKLQEKLAGTQKEVDGLMVKIDKAEAENVQSIAKLIGDLDPTGAAKMLTAMMKTNKAAMVPRVLLYMKQQKAAAILSNIVDQGTKEKIQEAIQATTEMQRLMGEKTK